MVRAMGGRVAISAPAPGGGHEGEAGGAEGPAEIARDGKLHGQSSAVAMACSQ